MYTDHILACVERDMNYEGNNVLGGSGYYSRYWNLKVKISLFYDIF